MLVLTTMYMPITRNSVIGAFCYYSIQCEFDCYNEQRHWNVVYLSVVQLVCVTVFLPVLLVVTTYHKRREFLGNRMKDVNTQDPGVEEDATLEQDWRLFLALDNSPLAGAYENLRFRWSYFQTVTVLSKAVCVVLALGLDRDTRPQLLGLLTLHCLTTFAVAYTNPFISDPSNVITMLGQVYIIFSLGLNALSRVNLDETLGTAAGIVLMATAALCFVTQVTVVLRSVSLSAVTASVIELLEILMAKLNQRNEKSDGEGSDHSVCVIPNAASHPTGASNPLCTKAKLRD